MMITTPRMISSLMTLALCITLSYVHANAETLNPEGINPHANAPRKRITQEQKQAAAEAMKKRKAEIEARKAAENAGKISTPVQTLMPDGSNSTSNDTAK